MASMVDGVPADTAFSKLERRVVLRLVASIERELGTNLRAIWLYGSRARGEADPNEIDPDRRSDIDLMVIVDSSCNAGRVGWELVELVERVASTEGDSPVYYSVLVWDTDRLRNRREIRSFFVQEVDRDKIVLAGSRLESPELA